MISPETVFLPLLSAFHGVNLILKVGFRSAHKPGHPRLTPERWRCDGPSHPRCHHTDQLVWKTASSLPATMVHCKLMRVVAWFAAVVLDVVSLV